MTYKNRGKSMMSYSNIQVHSSLMNKLTCQTKADTFRLQTYLELFFNFSFFSPTSIYSEFKCTTVES